MDIVKTNEDKIVCIVDGCQGVEVAKSFINSFHREHWNISKSDADILNNPDHDDYWEVWDEVLRDASFTDADGSIWSLYQDGDLFAVREDYDWDNDSL